MEARIPQIVAESTSIIQNTTIGGWSLERIAAGVLLFLIVSGFAAVFAFLAYIEKREGKD